MLQVLRQGESPEAGWSGTHWGPVTKLLMPASTLEKVLGEESPFLELPGLNHFQLQCV